MARRVLDKLAVPESALNSDGDFEAFNALGMKVSQLAGQADPVVGTLTASGQSVVAPVPGYTSALVTISGTYAGVSIVFELSDDGGTTYYPTLAERLDISVIEGATALAPGSNVSRAWYVRCAGATHFRVRSTAYTSGTANIRISPTSGLYQRTPLGTAIGGQAVAINNGGAATVANISSGSDGQANNNGLCTVTLLQAWVSATTTDKVRTPNVFKPVALSAATAETAIWTPASGKKFRLMGFILTCGAASVLTFKDGTGLATIFVARGGVDVPISPSGMGNGILSGAADRVLTVTRGTSCTLDGTVFGIEE